MEKPKLGDVALSEKNFRWFAKQAIQQYAIQNMVVDEMVWGAIIGYYERYITELEAKAKRK